MHPPLVDTETFEQVQALRAGRGRGKSRGRQRVQRPNVLRGLVHCGVCERRMQGQWTHDRAYYRCRCPREYALANLVEHPANVHVAEHEVLEPFDGWLAGLFAPDQIEGTVRDLHRAQDAEPDPAAAAVERVSSDCNARLAGYRSALDAGADPVVVAG